MPANTRNQGYQKRMPRSVFKSDSIWIHAAILLALSLPYFVNLGESSIWNTNEAFYAETPREMLVTGDYLAPMFNYEIRAQKPPITYWAILLSYKLFGVNEFAVRFPGALAALGVLLFSYGAARLLFGSRAAWIAAIIAATTPRIFILVRRLPIDMLLLFFLSGILFFLICAIHRRKLRFWILVYVFAGLGFLTKGPIALAIPAGACLVWKLLSRRLKLSEMHLPMGIAVFALITMPWYILIYRIHGWTYISPFFLRDNLARFAVESMGPARGPFYYFSAFAGDFFPWSLLFLFALLLLWKNRKAIQPVKGLSFGFPLIWCALIFLIFSLSKNKQEYYIAPMYPAAAVVLSGVIAAGLRTGRKDKHMEPEEASENRAWDHSGQIPCGKRMSPWIWPYSVLALMLFLLSLFTPFFLGSFLPDLSFYLHYAPSLFFAAGAALLVFSLIRKRPGHCFFSTAFPLWIIFLMAALFYVPALEKYRPVKSFCMLIKAESGQNDEAGFFLTAVPSMAFYLERPIFQENSYDQMIERFSSGKRVFCVLAAKDYEYFMDKGVKIHVLDRRFRFSIRLNTLLHNGYLPEEELLLVSNQPLSG
jgi:4-amino-4-deoxy-L-arabinose transferase-like glycosyltransferase